MNDDSKVRLSSPLQFGDQSIDILSLRRPTAGDMRGIKLRDIIDMDVSTICILAERISLTPLAPSQLKDLDPADLLQLSVTISNFFEKLPRSQTTH
jgi:hypothetical protein